jgi:hypothetical protein
MSTSSTTDASLVSNSHPKAAIGIGAANSHFVREAAIGGVFDVPIWMQMQRRSAQSPHYQISAMQLMSAIV